MPGLAVLHVIPDTGGPWRSVTLRDAIAPGSYLVIRHATAESRPRRAFTLQAAHNRSVAARAAVRPRAAIERFFDGFQFVPPGLVYIPQWRPDAPAEVPDDPGKFWGLVGVGRKL